MRSPRPSLPAGQAAGLDRRFSSWTSISFLPRCSEKIKTPFPAGKGRQDRRSKRALRRKQRSRHDQFPVARGISRPPRQTCGRFPGSWINACRPPSRYGPVAQKMAASSPNTVTGSYRIRTCFPFTCYVGACRKLICNLRLLQALGITAPSVLFNRTIL